MLMISLTNNPRACNALHQGAIARLRSKRYLPTNRDKSMIASLPSDFPIAYWCCLLEQCDLSVDIVCPFRQNPKLSAWAAMEGDFHFGLTPIAPPGSAMLMQLKPDARKTFGLNAKKSLVHRALPQPLSCVSRHVTIDKG